jgi:hypothetical protein
VAGTTDGLLDTYIIPAGRDLTSKLRVDR